MTPEFLNVQKESSRNMIGPSFTEMRLFPAPALAMSWKTPT